MSEVAPSVRVSALAASVVIIETDTFGNPFDSLVLGTLVIPTTVQVGDCLILATSSLNDIPSPGIEFDLGLPGGWTQIAKIPPAVPSAFGPGMNVWWKTATASDPGSTVLTDIYDCAGVIAYQNAAGSTPFLASVTYPYLALGYDFPQLPAVPASSTVLEIVGVWENTNTPGDSIAGDVFAFSEGTPQGQVAAPNNWYGMLLGFCDQVQAADGVGMAALGVARLPFGEAGVVVTLAIPPLAASYTPTLLSPVNSSTADLALTPEFDWKYNPSLNNGPQVAYAFRRKIAGASSYQYWNASTSSFGGTIVWNPSAAQSVVFPTGKWTDGNVYNWSVATEDSISGLEGAFAPDFTVTAQQSASVVVNTPVGFTTAFDPIIAWTATFPGSFAQIAYRAVIYADTQYTAGGFIPGLGPSVWDSGVVAGTVTSIPSLIPQAWNGHALRAYVQVIETNNDPSPWAFSAFTLEVDGPAQPTVSATPGVDGVTGAPLVAVVVSGHDNFLSAVDASFETGGGTWVAGSNTTVAQTNAQSADGAHSLSLAATGSGAMSAVSGHHPVQH